MNLGNGKAILNHILLLVVNLSKHTTWKMERNIPKWILSCDPSPAHNKIVALVIEETQVSLVPKFHIWYDNDIQSGGHNPIVSGLESRRDEEECPPVKMNKQKPLKVHV